MEPENMERENIDPENQLPSATAHAAEHTEPVLSPGPGEPAPPAQPVIERELYRGLRWILIGPQGLRAGWSVLLFIVLFYTVNVAFYVAALSMHLVGRAADFTPRSQFFIEVANVLALLTSVALVGLIEGRRIPAYNLTGTRRPRHFLIGLASGFLGLSALIAMLAAGGWLHFGPVTLSSANIFRYALEWGCVFLLGGCFEEGMFRCYGLFTLTRGLNFWWALGSAVVACAYLAIFVGGNASWGVYTAALLGLLPCYLLYRKPAARTGSSGFWYATWVTSILFGYIHIDNPNEAAIGIFAAAFIGFVFCISVRVTGSAWWAIGCHAGWDWAETYLYGTSDSGLAPHGSYLTSTPSGNPLWSGGAVGPEGSLLVLAAILFLLALVLIYARFSARAVPAPA